jgi:3-hydroxybutyrate dehydrogenase
MNVQLKAQETKAADAKVMRPLAGKVSLVTGSTSGIGLGIARALAEAGSAVVLNGLGVASEVAKTKDQIEADFGVKVSYSAADMTRPEAIAEMIAATIVGHGRLDILVNNAGIQFVAPLDQFPVEKWDAILSINLSSAFHTTRLALPAMRQNKFGRIINIASAHGLVGSPFKSAYVAAKHGIVGLTKVAALETAEDGITCNAICPGYVYTGRGADRRPGQGARHLPGESHSRRVAGAATQQAFRLGRGVGRAEGLSRKRCSGIDHRDCAAGRRRLDRTLKRERNESGPRANIEARRDVPGRVT